MFGNKILQFFRHYILLTTDHGSNCFSLRQRVQSWTFLECIRWSISVMFGREDSTLCNGWSRERGSVQRVGLLTNEVVKEVEVGLIDWLLRNDGFTEDERIVKRFQNGKWWYYCRHHLHNIKLESAIDEISNRNKFTDARKEEMRLDQLLSQQKRWVQMLILCFFEAHTPMR